MLAVARCFHGNGVGEKQLLFTNSASFLQSMALGNNIKALHGFHFKMLLSFFSGTGCLGVWRAAQFSSPHVGKTH